MPAPEPKTTPSPAQLHDLVAIALVVEGSIPVSDEWGTIMVDYLSPMLKRIGDTLTNPQVSSTLSGNDYTLISL
jgi:hypothetical protein